MPPHDHDEAQQQRTTTAPPTHDSAPNPVVHARLARAGRHTDESARNRSARSSTHGPSPSTHRAKQVVCRSGALVAPEAHAKASASTQSGPCGPSSRRAHCGRRDHPVPRGHAPSPHAASPRVVADLASCNSPRVVQLTSRHSRSSSRFSRGVHTCISPCGRKQIALLTTVTSWVRGCGARADSAS
jgi:hypothetical protein